MRERKEKVVGGAEIVCLLDGKYITGSIEEGPAGPYDEIEDFGKPDHLVGEISPVVKRFKNPRSSCLVITGGEDDNIRERLVKISRIVNDPSRSYENPDDRFFYQQTIMPVFERGMEELRLGLNRQGNLNNNNFVICGPLRGGEFTISALLWSAAKVGWDVPLNRTACYELKRVKMENGQLLVGARKGFWPECDFDTTTVYLDDCIASSRSSVVTTRMSDRVILGGAADVPYDRLADGWRHVIDKRRREHCNLTVVAVAAQQGINVTDRTQVIAGDVAYAISDKYYILRTREEGFKPGSFYVGDMGSWLGRLPESYNNVAPWNEVRKSLLDYWYATQKLPKNLLENGYHNWQQ